MRFVETKLAGAFIVEPTVHADVRGEYVPTFSRAGFVERGLNGEVVECNLSTNRRAGTLRGMHYQASPHGQTKLVRCTRGAVWDAIVDLRPGSATFRQWVGVELSAGNRRQLYIPEGFAHGFITLEDESEVLYQMGGAYVPAASRGVRWDDPAFGIEWPRGVSVIIERDAGYADFEG